MFRVLGIHNFALRLNLHFFFQHSQTGVTALMAVSGHGDLDTIHDLLRYHAKPSLKSKQGWTALDFAQKQNQQDAVLYLQDIMKRQKILTNPGN